MKVSLYFRSYIKLDILNKNLIQLYAFTQDPNTLGLNILPNFFIKGKTVKVSMGGKSFDGWQKF